MQAQLSRIVARAPYDGVAVFADPDEWQGRPVVAGERIMLLANPDKPGMLIHLPVADAITLDVGAPVKLFLTVHPLTPLSGQLVKPVIRRISMRMAWPATGCEPVSMTRMRGLACVARPSCMETGWCWATMFCAAHWPSCASGAAGEAFGSMQATIIPAFSLRCGRICACILPADRDGAPSWVIQDPVCNTFYQIGWLEYECLLRWSGEPERMAAEIEASTPLVVDAEQVAAFE